MVVTHWARLDQDAVRGGHAGADHDSGGRGQAQRARARDDQHGNAKQQRKQENVVPLRQPVRRVPVPAAGRVPAQRGLVRVLGLNLGLKINQFRQCRLPAVHLCIRALRGIGYLVHGRNDSGK